MLNAPAFGPRLAWLSIALGAVGAIGAAIEIVDPSLELSALSVLAIVVFHLAAGLRTLRLGRVGFTDVVDPTSTSTG